MARKLTNKEYQDKLNNISNNNYTLIGDYNGKTSLVDIRCEKHNIIFTVTAECFMRPISRGKCPKCLEEENQLKYSSYRTLVECTYCGKEFYKSNSKLENSRSGLYFCCREHKDLAQTLQFNCIEIQPKHYLDGKNYRKQAFRKYEHKCSVCGWNEDEDILEVHHIDENHENNDLKNLKILCPICHRKLTSHKYKLVCNNIVKII